MRVNTKPKDPRHGSNCSLDLRREGLAGTQPCFCIFQTWREDFKAIYITIGIECNKICCFGKGARASILCKFKALVFADSLYVSSMSF